MLYDTETPINQSIDYYRINNITINQSITTQVINYLAIRVRRPRCSALQGRQTRALSGPASICRQLPDGVGTNRVITEVPGLPVISQLSWDNGAT